MRNMKHYKKLIAFSMVGVLSIGTALNVSAAEKTSGIGTISISISSAEAITTISTAASPAIGFTGSAKITATATNNQVATRTVVSANSKTKARVTSSETSNANLYKASSVHKEYYNGNVISNLTVNLSITR